MAGSRKEKCLVTYIFLMGIRGLSSTSIHLVGSIARPVDI